MAIQYKNRFGDVYFLQAGKTKTGKPKYYFSKKETGQPVSTIPAGFEIRENPETAGVTLRRIRPTEISPLEERMLSDGIRDYAKLKRFIVDVEDNSLVVYLPGTQEQDAQEMSALMGSVFAAASKLARGVVSRSRYSPMMRFTLTDPDERLFCVERWCFRGSIDDWFPLARLAPLPTLIATYVRHLGRESFYELM